MNKKGICIILTSFIVNISNAQYGDDVFTDDKVQNFKESIHSSQRIETNISSLSKPANGNTNSSSFGKGVRFIAPDSTFSINFSARFQSLLVVGQTLDNGESDPESSFMIRRSRLKFDGFAFKTNITYKIELGLSNRDMGKPITQTGNAPGFIYDAVLKWEPVKNFSIWVGQTKLPGNRERVISSQQLQLVDRSIVNAEFNIDRDAGIQLHHNFKVGKMVFREAFSLSSGEGRNITTNNTGGFDYTGRIEWLPFGNFKNKGDYSGSDLEREDKLKLSIGIGYDYNDDASRVQGQLGNFLPGTTDLSMIMSDMMLKYKGFSVMAEYMNKEASNPVLTDTGGAVLGEFYTGYGYTVQAGYLLKNNLEFCGRYSQVVPVEEISENQVSQYTFGVSRYFKAHNLKIQSDVSLKQEDTVDDDEFMFRFQIELAF